MKLKIIYTISLLALVLMGCESKLNKLTKKEVLAKIDLYDNQGKPEHFTLSNGKQIRGYVFHRDSVNELFKKNGNKPDSLYLFFGLDNDPTSSKNSKKSIIDMIGLREGNIVNTSNVIISTPYTKKFKLGNITYKTDKLLIEPNTDQTQELAISADTANAMIIDHLVLKKELTLKHKDTNCTLKKTLGFILTSKDINSLKVDSGGPNYDLVLLLGLNKDNECNDTSYSSRVNLITGWLKTRWTLERAMIHDNLEDYAQPCPGSPHCPTVE